MKTAVSDPADNQAAFQRLQSIAASGAPGSRKAMEAVTAATTRGLEAAVRGKPQ